MREWKFWDLTAYGCLIIAALVVAYDTALKGTPNLAAQLPSIEGYWGFIPLLLIAIGTLIFLVRAMLYKPAITPKEQHAFTKEFLDVVERLCADEHELALRHQWQFQSGTLPDKDKFRAVLADLKAQCVMFGLVSTVDALDDSIARIKNDTTANGGYWRFNAVSQALKRELKEKFSLTRL